MEILKRIFSRKNDVEGNSGDIGPGMVLTIILPSGHYGACLVVRPAGMKEGGWFIVGLEGFWSEKPLIRQFKNRSFLKEVRFKIGGDVLKAAISGFPGPEFLPLGKVDLTPEEKSLAEPYYVFQGWDDLLSHVFAEWRWIHDRPAFEKEVEEKEKIRALRLAEKEQEKAKRLKKLTLKDLLKTKPFSDWGRLWPKKAVTEARSIYQTTVQKLVALGKPSSKDLHKIIGEMVEGFNRLEEDYECIETEEREEIVERIEEILSVLGAKEDIETLLANRTW